MAPAQAKPLGDVRIALTIVMLLATNMVASTLAQSPQPPQAQTKQIQTLAVVNGHPISRQQVAAGCLSRFGESVLQGIVSKMLLLEHCRKHGVTITEGDVNNEIAQHAKKLGWSNERWVKTICERRELTVDQLKNDVIWEKLALRRIAEKNIEVTPQELAERFEFQFGPKVQVRQIVLDSLKQATQIRSQLDTNPDDFERMAKKFSIDTFTASLGGLLQPVRRHAGLPEFEELAFSLKPGEISKVLPVADKFIILRCERHFPAEKLTPQQETEIQDRFVAEISNTKLADAAQQLMAQLQETSEIVNVMNDPKLAKQFPGIAAKVNGTNILNRQIAEECITRYGKQMLETEINRAIFMQALKEAGIQISPSDIEHEVGLGAIKKGFVNKDGTPNKEGWIKAITNNDPSKVDIYIEDVVWPSVAMRKLVEPKVTVTEEDLQKGFEANYGPRVEVLAIMANDHRSALDYWEMATSNPTAEFFGQLAHQYSIEPASKANFGVVEPIQRHGGRPELEKEAFSLQKGEISKTIQIGDYWAILYCTGRTEPVVSDFDAVKGDLYDHILEVKMALAVNEEYARLREDAQIDNFLTGTSQTGRRAASRAAQLHSQQRGRLPVGPHRR